MNTAHFQFIPLRFNHLYCSKSSSNAMWHVTWAVNQAFYLWFDHLCFTFHSDSDIIFMDDWALPVKTKTSPSSLLVNRNAHMGHHWRGGQVVHVSGAAQSLRCRHGLLSLPQHTPASPGHGGHDCVLAENSPPHVRWPSLRWQRWGNSTASSSSWCALI